MFANSIQKYSIPEKEPPTANFVGNKRSAYTKRGENP